MTDETVSTTSHIIFAIAKYETEGVIAGLTWLQHNLKLSFSDALNLLSSYDNTKEQLLDKQVSMGRKVGPVLKRIK